MEKSYLHKESDRPSLCLITKCGSQAKPSLEIRSHIRSHSLKWNHLRNEWYGYVLDVQALKDGLGDLKYELQIIKE